MGEECFFYYVFKNDGRPRIMKLTAMQASNLVTETNTYGTVYHTEEDANAAKDKYLAEWKKGLR
jgi:hypothetical protein